MAFHLFHIITFLMLVVVGTNAKILPPQLYWKSMLPNTPMPKAITNLLHPGKDGYWSEGKATWVDANGIGGPFDYQKYDESATSLGRYAASASETQLHEKSSAALFLLENNLHYGKKFNMQFTKTISNNNGPKFLPKEVADSIPFSSNKLENILDKFSIKKESKESKIIKNTINECEEKGIKGEEKLCVTSLESMVDFATSKLGNNVEAISNKVEKESSEIQQYVITKGVKRLGEKNKAIVCHKENYPYAVFYCHKIDPTKVYSVPLKGVDDGNRVEAVVVCHTDTSQWNPKHLAFQVLKVQPGTVPICHFLPHDHVVWVSK